MKIGVNLLPFNSEFGGVGRYAKNILPEIVHHDTKNNFIIYTNAKFYNELSSELKQTCHIIQSNFVKYGFIARIIYEQIVFPVLLYFHKVDLLFTPSLAIPILYMGIKFTTIHDVIFKYERRKYPPLRRFYIDLMTQYAYNNSDIVLTVSNHTKTELEALYNKHSNDIVVTYNGVDPAFFEVPEPDFIHSVKMKYQLPDNYLFYCGAIEPGKNLSLLLDSFADFIAQQGNNSYDLVLTAGIGWRKKEALMSGNLSYEKIKTHISFLPFVSDRELNAIYRGAIVVIYLSEYEGFGLPVLEALACGKPVITSSAKAVLEFAHEACFSISNLNTSSVVSEINKIISNSDEIGKKMVSGLKVAQSFTWTVSAMKFLQAVKKYDS